METKDLERTFLEILESDEIQESAGIAEAEAAVKDAFPDLDDEARAQIARVMRAEMPTPEEIQQAEEIAQHNAQLKAKREDELRLRVERRAARGKLRKKRKRKK